MSTSIREKRAFAALAQLGHDPRPHELRVISQACNVGLDALQGMTGNRGSTTTAGELRLALEQIKARRPA